ncbi:MAG: MFS transporter [Chloroflexi bacterium]|nr:MFS transporter [Chloroflexota bacterium]
MFHRLRSLQKEYPAQYWLLFWGMLVSSAGISLIWPFLTIYLREKLDLPLTTVASLITLSSVATLVASLIAGPIMDRFGRKIIMVASLFLSAVTFVLMSFASTLPQFMILMLLRGAFTPLYSVAADAMVADLIETDRRVEAYSLLRIVNNVGIALGPAVGGFITSSSYSAAFNLGGASLLIFALLVLFTIQETAPLRAAAALEPASSGGYLSIFKDRFFMSFCGAFTFSGMMSALVFVLLSVYVKENFSIPESQFGFLMTTNALVVVLFQFAVSRISNRHPPLRVLATGALVYAVGVGSIAFGRGFFAFMLSIIVLTFGELLIAPTATTLVSQIAPAHLRGSYMGVFSLTVGVARGLGPIYGGVLNDKISPAAIWYGGLVVGLIAAIWYYRLYQIRRKSKQALMVSAQTSSGGAS